MAEKVHKLSKDRYKELEKKLKFMKSTERQNIADRIRQAKEFGQLEENTEYENAKEEQARLEQEILKLEEILRNAQIIEKVDSTKVDVGTTVEVELLEEKKKFMFKIVSSHESDPGRKKIPMISDESPVGSSLMGKEKGDEVEVEIPLGKVHYKILNIVNN